MPTKRVELSLIDDDGILTEAVDIEVETIQGLWVHRDVHDRGWVVSTRGGLAVLGAPVVGGTPLPSRKVARESAKMFASMIPEAVKDGSWSGREWLAQQPLEARMCKHELTQWSRKIESYSL